MPAYMAHFTCGYLAEKAFNQSEHACGKLAGILRDYPGTYHIALAGPDIFFYSIPDRFRKTLRIGRAVHKYRTDQFLQALYREAMALSGEERRIALAYFTGFLGHYCLDASAHPLVYRICEHPDEAVALGKHFRYEAAMDAECCLHHLGRDIRDIPQLPLMRLSHREKHVIAVVLNQAVRKIYPDSPTRISYGGIRLLLCEHRIITALLFDVTGFKEWLVLGLEKAVQGYPLLSPLFINANRYGTDERDWAHFNRRFMRGEVCFAQLLDLVDDTVSGHISPNELYAAIGSRSYHTGRHKDGAETEIDWS